MVQIVTTLAAGGAQATVVESANGHRLHQHPVDGNRLDQHRADGNRLDQHRADGNRLDRYPADGQQADGPIEVTTLAGADGRDGADAATSTLWHDPRLRPEATIEVPGLVRRMSPVNDVRALLWLVRWLRRNRPDIVHTHSSKAGVLGRLAAAVCGVRRVHTVHGWGPLHHRNRAVAAGARWVERLLARLSTALVVVGTADLRFGLERRIGRPDRYRVVRSGVDLSIGRAAAGERAAVRAELARAAGREPYRDETFVVGMAARLAHPKDHRTLIAAFQQAAIANSRLVLVGDGPLRVDIEGAVAAAGLGERVDLVGARPDAARLVAGFDVSVLSSRWEGMPRAVVEAAAAGTPIVAADVGSVSDLIEDGVSGRLVRPNDAAALATALRHCGDDRSCSRSMAAVAAERVAAFSANRMRQDLRDLWRSVAKPGPATSSARDSAGRLQPALWAVCAQAVSSITNFGLVVALFLTMPPDALGRLLGVISVYLLALTLSRSMVTEPMVARSDGGSSGWAGPASMIRPVLAISAGAGAVAATVGLLLGVEPEQVAMITVALPILLRQDAHRYQAMAAARHRAAVVLDGIWLAVSLVTCVLLVELAGAGPTGVVAAWTVGGVVSWLAGVTGATGITELAGGAGGGGDRSAGPAGRAAAASRARPAAGGADGRYRALARSQVVSVLGYNLTPLLIAVVLSPTVASVSKAVLLPYTAILSINAGLRVVTLPAVRRAVDQGHFGSTFRRLLGALAVAVAAASAATAWAATVVGPSLPGQSLQLAAPYFGVGAGLCLLYVAIQQLADGAALSGHRDAPARRAVGLVCEWTGVLIGGLLFDLTGVMIGWLGGLTAAVVLWSLTWIGRTDPEHVVERDPVPGSDSAPGFDPAPGSDPVLGSDPAPECDSVPESDAGSESDSGSRAGSVAVRRPAGADPGLVHGGVGDGL